MGERKAFKDLILSDNFMFGEVMSDKNICRMFLSELLKKDFVEIDFIAKELTFDKIYYSQGVRLDIMAKDASGKIYDIEMQSTNKKDIERRSRFYVSNIDKEYFPKGHKDYNELKDCYVIFICTYDHVGKGYALYEKTSYYNHDPEMPCDDGAHLLILNAAYDREKSNIELPIEEFLSIINGVESNYSTALARDVSDRITEVKNDHGRELAYMTLEELIQDERDEARAEGINEGMMRGRAEGKTEGKAEGIAEVLRNLGMSEAEYQKILKRV